MGRPALVTKMRQLALSSPAPVARLLLSQAKNLAIAYAEFKLTPRHSDEHAEWLAFQLILARFSARAAYEAASGE